MTRPVMQLLHGQYTPITDAHADEFRTAGWWRQRSIRSLLTAAAAAHPDRTALVGYRTSGPTTKLTYREFDRIATQVASGFDALGVEQGEAVAVMLPNWVEFCALIFGINEAGGIYTGIPVSYGPRHVAAIVRRSKAKVLVIPQHWRGIDHLELARELRAEIPTLQHIVVVGSESTDLRSGEYNWDSFIDVPERTFEQPDPAELCYLGFTSGTTGEPKGAMHTHDTLFYAVKTLADHIGPITFGEPMVQLVGSPVGHHSGFVWGVLFTVHLAGTGVYMDRWDATWAAEIIRSEGVTTFFGAPTFLQDMMTTELAKDPNGPLTCVVVAGAPVPKSLVDNAENALGAYIAPAWGMTECSILTSCTPAVDGDIRYTDGSVFDGSQVRIVDESGVEVPVGTIGELLVRGPGVTVGYYDREDATAESFLPGLWFRTGDTARIDHRGWLSLRGRSKDIIIRGGENIPVTEVESLLFEHPDIANAAVVGYPDERLGERACAVVVARPGTHPNLRDVADFLLSKGLSKHHIPEKLVEVDQMPTTPSGKIQKFKLRDVTGDAVGEARR